MNASFKQLWRKLTDKEYREAFVASQIKRVLPKQIRVLRKDREWTQADLASAANLTQGAISRAEDPDYGNLTINNLLRIAAGFDVAFVGRFVPFSDLAKWYVDLSEESLAVPRFDNDAGFIERIPVAREDRRTHISPNIPYAFRVLEGSAHQAPQQVEQQAEKAQKVIFDIAQDAPRLLVLEGSKRSA